MSGSSLILHIATKTIDEIEIATKNTSRRDFMKPYEVSVIIEPTWSMGKQTRRVCDSPRITS